MADARIEKWIKGAVGRGMNLDKVYGYQCVDVVNDYGNTLFGNWQTTVGRGNAKDKWNIMPTKYWEKIKNDTSKSNQIPQRGDVIVWNGWTANPVGHIAVVESADKSGVNVIQQDGVTNTRPTHRARLPYVLGGKLPIGWLRPKLAPVVSELDKVKAQLKAAQAELTKVKATLATTQDALKKTNAALDQAKLQYEITGKLQKQIETAEKKNDELIAQIDTLKDTAAKRDEAVNSLWKSIGDFLNKILGR